MTLTPWTIGGSRGGCSAGGHTYSASVSAIVRIDTGGDSNSTTLAMLAIDDSCAGVSGCGGILLFQSSPSLSSTRLM